MNRELADLRENYEMGQLDRSDLLDNPIEQFAKWMDDAKAHKIIEPNAMTLSTLSSTGYPSARIVLLKDMTDDGFVFYTNYESQKGQEMAANPRVSLTFLWKRLERQVRITGEVAQISRARTNKYFATRPHSSKLGAYASPQSAVIADRTILEDRKKELLQQYPEGFDLEAPANWGGYEVVPLEIEFWQGRPSRLHDRFRYQRGNSTTKEWIIDRLAP